MLCESSLWRVAFCSSSECVDFSTCHSDLAPKLSPLTSKLSVHTRASVHSSPNSPKELQSQDSDSQLPSAVPLDSRRLSPSMGIPERIPSPVVEAFLVPPSCQSICQHYSDLHIAGGQVMPLCSSTGDPQASILQDLDPGPFLLSKDVPFPSFLPPPPPDCGSTRCWREGSGRERPSLLQDGIPLSNSELNGYLERKLLELYTEYMTEGPMMASELEQITLQLSREHKLETARAKDIVLSCLLRVTSSYQSSEISTPLLQISSQTK